MLKQGLQQKQQQKLSPLQIQTIKLLELPTLELEQKIRKEIEENPVLDEITESADAECTDRIIHAILQLKSYGMQVYLDDFGVEYSNLNRVVSWPVDVIKIDKNLTWSMRNAKHLETVIGDIISSLKKAGYKILFEGIETEDDFERCKALKASYLQGFKYSQPIDYSHLVQFFDVTT